MAHPGYLHKTGYDQIGGFKHPQFSSDLSTQFPYIMSDDNRSVNTVMMPPGIGQIDSDI